MAPIDDLPHKHEECSWSQGLDGRVKIDDLLLEELSWSRGLDGRERRGDVLHEEFSWSRGLDGRGRRGDVRPLQFAGKENDGMSVYTRPQAGAAGAGGRGRTALGIPHLNYSSSHGRSKLLSGRVKSSRLELLVGYFRFLFSYLVRRHVVLLLFPVIYISGMILYMGAVPGSRDDLPGSVYRSPQVFENLWPQMMNNDGFHGSSLGGVEKAWVYAENASWKSNYDRHLLAVPGSVLNLPTEESSNGWIIIEANGGLNQQRSSICNAVAVARMLNATLVIPSFHLNSVWQDNSTFGQIYDEDHFIASLAEDVKIVRKLPSEVYDTFGSMSNIFSFKIKAWAPAEFYLEKVLPKLLKARVVRFSPFANRLAFDDIPFEIQQLRCRTNFQALRFAESISSLGDILMQRMISQSFDSGGKFIAIHLRYEVDMVAFSCCVYDGGEEEKIDMDAAREKGWRGKFTRPGRTIDPGSIRRNGKCPLTPLEVGMMLRGMGYSSATPIYLAAGKIYQAERTLAPLRQMFPNLHTKETLLSADELAPFRHHSTRMAALDYTVCLHSEVFVTTHGGNFPQLLIGHRRILNKGHSKTIRPDKRKLAVILDDENISWERFSTELRDMRLHTDKKGHELRKPAASIYTYPAPDCMIPIFGNLQVSEGGAQV